MFAVRIQQIAAFAMAAKIWMLPLIAGSAKLAI